MRPPSRCALATESWNRFALEKLRLASVSSFPESRFESHLTVQSSGEADPLVAHGGAVGCHRTPSRLLVASAHSDDYCWHLTANGRRRKRSVFASFVRWPLRIAAGWRLNLSRMASRPWTISLPFSMLPLDPRPSSTGKSRLCYCPLRRDIFREGD
jgi:hypothetical protein